MNKYTYAALALIAAVPGGFLCYLLVMAMLNDFAQMVVMMRVLAGAMLAFAALATVLPVGILIFVKDEKEEAEEAEAEGIEPAGEEGESAGVPVTAAEPEADVADVHPGDEVEITETGSQEPMDDFPPEAADADQPETDQSVVLETDFGDDELSDDEFSDEEFEFTDEEEPDEKPNA